jgi:hypothetical protein
VNSWQGVVYWPKNFKFSFPFSADGAKGLTPEYFFKAKAPAWWIWFMAKAPWDFIILARSSKVGRSFSLIARGLPGKQKPSYATAVAPRIYMLTPVARVLR